jgi:hypothetical protein
MIVCFSEVCLVQADILFPGHVCYLPVLLLSVLSDSVFLGHHLVLSMAACQYSYLIWLTRLQPDLSLHESSAEKDSGIILGIILICSKTDMATILHYTSWT